MTQQVLAKELYLGDYILCEGPLGESDDFCKISRIEFLNDLELRITFSDGDIMFLNNEEEIIIRERA